MTRNLKWILPPIALGAMVLAYGWLTRDDGDANLLPVAGALAQTPTSAPPASPQPLEFLSDDLMTLQLAPLRRTAAFSGSVVATRTVLVKARVAGELTEVAARQGQAVAAGHVVAKIDPTEVQARVNARAADVEVARAQLQLSEKNRDAQRSLLAKNFISQNAFDSAQSGYEVAVARLHVAEAELVSARKSLGDAVLTAPMTGIVAERFAEPGERVAVDARILSIVDLSRLEIEASLPANEIGGVSIGQHAEFRVEGFGDRRFAGRVVRISPVTAAGSRSIVAYVALNNPGNVLRAGLFAKGEILLAKDERVLAVPTTALREEAGKFFVYQVTDKVLRRQAVEIRKLAPDGLVPIVSGLKAGDVVVRNYLGNLREGAPVRIRGAGAAVR